MCRPLLAERCALNVGAGYGQQQVASPTLEGMQLLGRNAHIEPKGDITMALMAFSAFNSTGLCSCLAFP